MRHGKKFNHLGRKTAHRKAMLSNMACSLIEHKSINTTLAKAKALRGYVEPLITKSKADSTHSRRIVFSHLQSKEAVTELFREIAPKVADRPGGYTRIIRTGYRLGDNAEMCMIELVDFNEIYTNEKAKSTTRRSRRGGSAKSAAAPAEGNVEGSTEEVKAETTAEVVEEVKAEEVKAEEVVEAPVEEVTEVEAKEEAAAEEVVEEKEETSSEPEAKADDSEEEEKEK